MTPDLGAITPKRDFLALSDFSRTELSALVAAAAELKAGKGPVRPLAGKSLGLILAQSSTRTRVSFEVGAYQARFLELVGG